MPGQATFVRWKRRRVSILSFQLPNPHEPRQCGLSHVDGQVRNRATSDLPGSSESAGRCTPKVLHTDVLFVGLDNERQCPKSCPICGSWMTENGNALLELRWQLQSSSLQLGTFANSAAFRTALLQWCCSSRNFGANPTVSAGNGTSADDDQMQAKANTKTRKEFARPARPTRALQTSTRARTVAELDIERRTAGDQVEERTTIPPGNNNTKKGKTHKKGKGKSKHVDVVEMNQPSVSYPSQTPSTIGRRTVDHGVTMNSVSTRRQPGAEYLLLDCAQLHACPIFAHRK